MKQACPERREKGMVSQREQKGGGVKNRPL